MNFITSKYGLRENMHQMAMETGGKYIPLASWEKEADINLVIYNDLTAVRNAYVSVGDKNIALDSDEDGLYDIYEEKGMRLSNARIVKTNSGEKDSDRDDINDFLAMGGAPTEETFTVDGETFTSVVNRGAICNELPAEFIYVDGRANANGETYDGKMNRVTHSDEFETEKYVTPVKVELFNDLDYADGAAGVHGIFSEKLADENEYVTAVNYMLFNTLIVTIIANLAGDVYASNSFYTYISGTGGPYQGCTSEGTRDYFPANYLLEPDWFGGNSAYSYFDENMQSAKYAAESVLNEYNQEVYIALSPEHKWFGCHYMNHGDVGLKDIYGIATNISAFGIFNSADASVTMHCTYDPLTKQYNAEYVYYIVDFYDYSLFPILYEEDALGLARSYELFGKCEGTMIWKSGEKGWYLY